MFLVPTNLAMSRLLDTGCRPCTVDSKRFYQGPLGREVSCFGEDAGRGVATMGSGEAAEKLGGVWPTSVRPGLEVVWPSLGWVELHILRVTSILLVIEVAWPGSQVLRRRTN